MEAPSGLTSPSITLILQVPVFKALWVGFVAGVTSLAAQTALTAPAALPLKFGVYIEAAQPCSAATEDNTLTFGVGTIHESVLECKYKVLDVQGTAYTVKTECTDLEMGKVSFDVEQYQITAAGGFSRVNARGINPYKLCPQASLPPGSKPK